MLQNYLPAPINAACKIFMHCLLAGDRNIKSNAGIKVWEKMLMRKKLGSIYAATAHLKGIIPLKGEPSHF